MTMNDRPETNAVVVPAVPVKATKWVRFDLKERTIRGVSVTFYKRRARGCWVMDWTCKKLRVQKNTDAFTLEDAAAVAGIAIERVQQEGNGLAAKRRAEQAQRGPCATVSDVLQRLDSEAGRAFWPSSETRRTYATSLRQLAESAAGSYRGVTSGGIESLTLDKVLTEAVLEAFQAGRQGLPRVNVRACLPGNGGANSTLRNVRAIFMEKAVRAVFEGLKLPDLEAFRAVPYLPVKVEGFQEWPVEVYRAFDAGAARLRDLRCDGPLAPGMLVRAVYVPRGHAAREMGDKEGVLLSTGNVRCRDGGADTAADAEVTARVQWVWRGGEVIVHEVPLRHLRAVEVDYSALWLVNACLRRLGLRASELLAARRSWLERRLDRTGVLRWCLVVKDRPEEGFTLLKHGAARNLVLDEELAALLTARGEGWLIGPGMAASARDDLVERLHNTWLRQFIPDRVKANHELRMWAGSLVYRQTGSLGDTAYFLGHRTTVTTERFYARWWQSSAVLDARAVSVAPVG